MKALAIVFVLATPAAAMAQSPVSHTTPGPVESTVAVGMHVGSLPETYDDGGRRDPFASLVAPKRAASNAPRTGLAGLAMADVTVRGIVRHGQSMLAILEAPGKQSFVARLNDRLLDGSIKSIDSAGVVFLEASGHRNAQEVRKALRSAGEDAR
jgi:hypothetical protein